MRRLFTALLLTLAPLAGCDSGFTDPLVGTWELRQVEPHDGTTFAGPVGSTLTLGEGGSLAVTSGNRCEGGTYRTSFTVNQSHFEVDLGACTEAATTLETDLSLFLRSADREPPEYLVAPGSPPRLDLRAVRAEGMFYDLSFVRIGP